MRRCPASADSCTTDIERWFRVFKEHSIRRDRQIIGFNHLQVGLALLKLPTVFDLEVRFVRHHVDTGH